MSKKIEKEVKELNWNRLQSPYKATGLLVYWWNVNLYELREEAKKAGKYEGVYKHYDETFLAIYADLNKLLMDASFLTVLPFYNKLIKDLNSFSKTKGQEGCPMVVDQKNIYEIKFAKEFAERIPKILEKATTAVKADTTMPGVAKTFINSKVLGSSRLTTLLANAKTVEAGLPKSEPEQESFRM